MHLCVFLPVIMLLFGKSCLGLQVLNHIRVLMFIELRVSDLSVVTRQWDGGGVGGGFTVKG